MVSGKKEYPYCVVNFSLEMNDTKIWICVELQIHNEIFVNMAI